MTSSHYNNLSLWTAGHQNVQVFHWKELLEEWNDSLTMPPAIQTVIDNLKAASDPLSNHNPTINDFLRYFNWEQEGIKWFLYESIALRWMWGESRLDYVRDTIQEVDSLNSTFPVFPGSNANITIRHFLDTHLNEAERVYLGLLEPTVAANSEESNGEESDSEIDSAETRSLESENFLPTLRTPPRRVPSARSQPPPLPLPPRQIPTHHSNSKYPPVQILMLRDGKQKKDDVIQIHRGNTNIPSYSITFKDLDSKTSLRSTVGLSRSQVLQYLSIVLRLVQCDVEPFDGVQLLNPHMPTVVLPYDMDSKTRELLYESIEHTMDNWPTH